MNKPGSAFYDLNDKLSDAFIILLLQAPLKALLRLPFDAMFSVISYYTLKSLQVTDASLIAGSVVIYGLVLMHRSISGIAALAIKIIQWNRRYSTLIDNDANGFKKFPAWEARAMVPGSGLVFAADVLDYMVDGYEDPTTPMETRVELARAAGCLQMQLEYDIIGATAGAVIKAEVFSQMVLERHQTAASKRSTVLMT